MCCCSETQASNLSSKCAYCADLSEQQLLTLAQHMSQMLSQHKEALQALSDQHPEEAKRLALSALQLADHMPPPLQSLGSHHIWRMRLHEALMRSCIELGNQWPLVLSVAQKLVPVYELVYPQVSATTACVQVGVATRSSDKVCYTLESSAASGRELFQLCYELAAIVSCIRLCAAWQVRKCVQLSNTCTVQGSSQCCGMLSYPIPIVTER